MEYLQKKATQRQKNMYTYYKIGYICDMKNKYKYYMSKISGNVKMKITSPQKKSISAQQYSKIYVQKIPTLL